MFSILGCPGYRYPRIPQNNSRLPEIRSMLRHPRYRHPAIPYSGPCSTLDFQHILDYRVPQGTWDTDRRKYLVLYGTQGIDSRKYSIFRGKLGIKTPNFRALYPTLPLPHVQESTLILPDRESNRSNQPVNVYWNPLR